METGTAKALLSDDPSIEIKGEPFFLDGPSGRLFALYFPPSPSASRRGDILFIPPFAEEMNKARRMYNVQARELARRGFGTLLLDLYGTGESEGEFEDARWPAWIEDLKAALAWLRQRGATKISALGLRLGALLALELTRGGEHLEKVVLWQPISNGQAFMNQFLRLRLAASIKSGTKVTTGQLRECLDAGQVVEVAGYALSPELFAAVDALRLDDLAGSDGPNIDWIEVVSEQGRGLLPASAKVVEGWRACGIDVTARTVVGEPFWTTQETTVAPALVQATMNAFEGRSDDDA